MTQNSAIIDYYLCGAAISTSLIIQSHPRHAGFTCLEYDLDIRILESPHVTIMYNQGKEPLRRCMVRGPPPSLIHSVFPPSVSSLPSKVQVLYGGTDLFDYEVRRTFNNDMLLAFISSSCIAALVYILTSCSGMVSPAAPHGASPFVPPSVLLSGQSLPAWECRKWA